MATRTKRKLHRAHAREDAATRPLARLRDRPVVKALGVAAEAADQPPLVALNLLTVATGLALRRPQVARAGVKMLAAHALATGVKTLVKRNFDRTRPHAELAGKRRRAGPGDNATHDYSSFPSGHTAGAVAVAAAVADEFPDHAGAAHAAAAAVAAIQVPYAKHYASDVAAGALLGWLSAKLTNALVDRTAALLAERTGRAAFVATGAEA